MATREVTSLEEYLQTHIHFRKVHNLRTGLAYLCLEDFVLQHGTLFTEISPDQPTYSEWILGQRMRYRPRTPRACFHNAYCTAVASRGRLRYAEGYADARVMPAHHAWTVDPAGRVVDTTWCHDGDPLPGPGSAYLGLVFPIEYVREMRTTDNCSIIDQWQKGWPLLQNRFVGFGGQS
jgi:hypothetical protein